MIAALWKRAQIAGLPGGSACPMIHRARSLKKSTIVRCLQRREAANICARVMCIALMVPANRFGHGHFSAAELKTIQEVITLAVFGVFSVFFLKEPLTWNHILGFSFIALGAFFIFHKW